jgi:hypothetical protein
MAIPGASCTGTGGAGNFTPGADFTTSTPFAAYFGLTSANTSCATGGCKFSGLPATMGAAMGAGGGGCNKLARTGVAALLNAAALGNKYLNFLGLTYAQLYSAIQNGFKTCAYEPLATNLDNANNQDHSLCSGLPGTIVQPTITQSKALSSPVTVVNTTDLKVNAFPNPYHDDITFQFVSSKSGKAGLEVYDIIGRRLAIVYQGNVSAGSQITVKYKVPASSRAPIVYKLSVGDQSARGMLLPGDRNSNYKQP